MSEWQPIETAPKDGTEVLVWAHTLDGMRAVFDRFSKDPEDYLPLWRNVPNGGAGDWVMTYLDGGPTHWMPIPDPPKP